MKNKLFNLIARVTAVATILSTFAMTAPVKAANLEYLSATATRLKISENSDWDIRFWSPTGTAISSDITVEFDTTTNNLFDFTSVTDATLKVADSTGTDCAGNAAWTVLDSVPASITDGVITFVAGSAVSTNYCFQVLVGTGADGSSTEQPNNPGAAATYEIGIVMESGDIGQIAVPIVDDDQVTVTANVDPAMTFDLDTSIATGAETAAPYTVDFGTLDPTDSGVNVSGESLTHGDIHYIHMDLATNATHGAVITIQNANGANGMVSTSDGTDNIANSTTAAMSENTENYGFCVGGTYKTDGESLAAAGSWASVTSCEDDYDGADDDTANDTVALSSSAANLFTVSGPIAGGEAYLIGSADASVLTEAHDDYVDTLTFIATATF